MNFFSLVLFLFFFDRSKLVVYIIRRIFLNALLNSFDRLLLDAVVRVLHFFAVLFASLFLFFHPHVFAFLLCFHLHMRDIRRVLIMLPDHWPLYSSFHKIPARGYDTTYYVPGASSHSVFHCDRLH